MIDLSYSNVVCLTVNAWICTHVHLPFLSYSINFPPPLALLKLSCSKNTFSSVLWTLIINWGNIWWNVCSRSYTDSFSLSLSVQDAVGRHTSLSLHFKDGRLFCICHSSLRPIRWELCLIEGLWLVNLWRMNPLLLPCPETISILLIYQQPIRSHIYIIDPINSHTLDLPTNQQGRELKSQSLRLQK